jgi:hypothetical protein
VELFPAQYEGREWAREGLSPESRAVFFFFSFLFFRERKNRQKANTDPNFWRKVPVFSKTSCQISPSFNIFGDFVHTLNTKTIRSNLNSVNTFTKETSFTLSSPKVGSNKATFTQGSSFLHSFFTPSLAFIMFYNYNNFFVFVFFLVLERCHFAFILCIGFDITYSSLLFCFCPFKLDIFVILNTFVSFIVVLKLSSIF